MKFCIKLINSSLCKSKHFYNHFERGYVVKKLLGLLKDPGNNETSDGADVSKQNTHFQNWAEFENRGFIRPEFMRSWMIEQYGDPEKVLKLDTLETPSNKFVSCIDARRAYMYQLVYNPSDVLVKVHAASINPIDIRLCEGYGANLFNFKRNMIYDRIHATGAWLKFYQEMFGGREFPLILGRDFSGTVVDVGTKVFDIQVGDEVYGAPSLHHAGTLADYVCVDLSAVVQRPATLSHVEAASIPYVGLTVVASLRQLVSNPIEPKHALVLGGSGGIGTFAIQYLQSYGFTVTTTCSTEGVPICNRLGADCIDYATEDVDSKIAQDNKKFSIVFDPIAAASPNWAACCLVNNGAYVTLKSPLLDLTNKYGLLAGASNTYLIYLKNKLRNSKYKVHWSYFKSDRQALLEISRIIDAGLIKPVVKPENIFSFEDTPQAFKQLGKGHAKGKIVVNVSGLPEAITKPECNKIVHL